jgi:hypothetical protein
MSAGTVVGAVVVLLLDVLVVAFRRRFVRLIRVIFGSGLGGFRDWDMYEAYAPLVVAAIAIVIFVLVIAFLVRGGH